MLALLRALQLNQHVEVSIGVLYTLNRLACGRPHVAAFLRYVSNKSRGSVRRTLLCCVQLPREFFGSFAEGLKHTYSFACPSAILHKHIPPARVKSCRVQCLECGTPQNCCHKNRNAM